MNYRQLILMVLLVSLVASGVIAEELDEKLAKEAPHVRAGENARPPAGRRLARRG